VLLSPRTRAWSVESIRTLIAELGVAACDGGFEVRR
jgi:hypothetical protein